jgi:tetratricopeptide (TPR) repeat protein
VLPGTVVAERFAIERRAGAGAVGVVYRATDLHTGRAVALKLLHRPALGERFAREARILAELRHPGIVRYVAHGRTSDGAPYLAMEWLEGECLDARLRRGPLPVDDAVLLATRVAEALAAAHARGVVHRDLKPSNLFLPQGNGLDVRLIDFGIALGGALGDGAARGPGRPADAVPAIGTPAYMAPEQARGQRDVGARADVFSLGCVLFECLTGRAAFLGEHPMAVLAKVLLEDPPRVRELREDVPRPLDLLVSRLLAKDPDRRPEDGAAAARALAALADASASTRAPALTGPISLGDAERRLLSVVIAAPPPAWADDDATAPTMVPEAAEVPADRVARALAPFAPRLELLADGTVVATLASAGAATDQATGAARCALALAAELPGRPIALATGRGVVAGRLPVGEVIDRTARLLRDGAARGGARVRIDALTAGLLDTRFEIGGDERGLLLAGEHEPVDAGRSLLGRPSPCVGRDAERARLADLFAACMAGPAARAVLVTAPAGAGKSRLRQEVMEDLLRAAPGAAVIAGRGDPVSAGSPFGVLAPAIRRAASVRDGEPAAVQREKIVEHVRLRVADPAERSRVAVFLGELAGVPFPEEESVQLRAARRDAVLMGDQMRRAFEDLLAAECAARPVVVVLDDLQWGDLPSARFVGAALRNLARAPLFVIAFARPEVREALPDLWEDAGVVRMDLGPLPREACAALCAHALGEGADPALVDRIVDRAAGNAFALEELIRHAAGGAEGALPETVLAMIEARLAALPAEARRALRAASVFGQVFTRGGVTALLGAVETPGGAEALLAELTRRELVSPRGEGRFAGDVELAFRQAMVRDAAYATLTDADRALGHRLAGAFLEAAGEADAAVLAEHFERGEEPDRAVLSYRRAAAQALEGGDLVAAVSLCERGIALLRGRAAGGEVHEALGDLWLSAATAERWRGRNAEARRAGLEAMACLPRRSAGWYAAAAEVAVVCARLADPRRIVEIGEALAEIGDEGGQGAAHLVACARVASQLLYAGERALADALFAHMGRAEPAADPSVTARVEQARGVRALHDGDLPGHVAHMEASAQAFVAAGDLRGAYAQRVNAMFAQLELGAYAEVEPLLRDAIAGAERLGLLSLAALARCNLGVALAARGALDEAEAVEAEAVRAYEAQGDRRLAGLSRNNLAIILVRAGSHDRAEREARQALGEIGPNPAARAYTISTLARALLGAGRAPDARGAAREAMALLEPLGALEEGESAVRLVHAEALAASGDRRAAVEAIAAARARLLERAARIRDPALRDRFLRGVEDNARTLSLAEAWAGEV